MRSLAWIGLALAVVAQPARAEPLRYGARGGTYQTSWYGNILGDLPENIASQGGAILLGKDPRFRGYATTGDPRLQEYLYPSVDESFTDQPIGITIDLYRPGDTQGKAAASLFLGGTISGRIQGSPYSDRLHGGFQGDITQAELRIWYLPEPGQPAATQDWIRQNYSPEPLLPADLLAALTDPTRLHLSGFISDGRMNALYSVLRIDPPATQPAPIPEPGTILILGLGAAGLLWNRRAAHRRLTAPAR